MARKILLGALAAAALAAALGAYHLHVLRHSRLHLRLLEEAHTASEKKLHLEEVRRFPHPWNPYRDEAERWLREDGHEWPVPGPSPPP